MCQVLSGVKFWLLKADWRFPFLIGRRTILQTDILSALVAVAKPEVLSNAHNVNSGELGDTQKRTRGRRRAANENYSIHVRRRCKSREI